VFAPASRMTFVPIRPITAAHACIYSTNRAVEHLPGVPEALIQPHPYHRYVRTSKWQARPEAITQANGHGQSELTHVYGCLGRPPRRCSRFLDITCTAQHQSARALRCAPSLMRCALRGLYMPRQGFTLRDCTVPPPLDRPPPPPATTSSSPPPLRVPILQPCRPPVHLRRSLVLPPCPTSPSSIQPCLTSES